MKQILRIFSYCAVAIALMSCSEAPECWDDATKQAIAELLQEKYGWEKVKFFNIREIDSDFDTRVCVMNVEYESKFSDMGAIGMWVSQAMYGRKFTNGKEQIEYKIGFQQTEDYGRQAFVEILGIGDESDNELERYWNQLQHMPK